MERLAFGLSHALLYAVYVYTSNRAGLERMVKDLTGDSPDP